MKKSFTAKIRFIIILLFLISLIQGFIILQIVDYAENMERAKMDIINTIFITFFLQFVLVIILFFYIPVFLRKAFSDIHQILKDITLGVYSIDIDEANLKTNTDREFYEVIESIQSALESVLKFDNLKKDKIIEHHNRILALLKLTADGFIILDINGNIIYLNDPVSEHYPSLSEKANIIDSNFPPEIEKHIKDYCLSILNSKSKKPTKKFYSASLKWHVTMNSAIVRGLSGEPKGAVVSFENLKAKVVELQKQKEKALEEKTKTQEEKTKSQEDKTKSKDE
jgi:signal transduction histidine kinase